jgi:hypothetical protein
LYASPNIIRVIKPTRMRSVGHVASMGVLRNLYKILIKKPDGNTLSGRPKFRWEGDIKMYLRVTG